MQRRVEMFGLCSKEEVLVVATRLIERCRKGKLNLYKEMKVDRLRKHPMLLVHEMLRDGPISDFEITTSPEELRQLTIKQATFLMKRARSGKFDDCPVRALKELMVFIPVRPNGLTRDAAREKALGLAKGELEQLLKQETDFHLKASKAEESSAPTITLAAG